MMFRLCSAASFRSSLWSRMSWLTVRSMFTRCCALDPAASFLSAVTAGGASVVGCTSYMIGGEGTCRYRALSTGNRGVWPWAGGIELCAGSCRDHGGCGAALAVLAVRC